MKLNRSDIITFKHLLIFCKQIGIDAVAFANGQVMGIDDKRVIAIITKSPISDLLGDARLGIGRIGELLNRLELFDGIEDLEMTTGVKGDVTTINFVKGRSKSHFRCTSPSMMAYPKQNEDEPVVVIELPIDEVQQMRKALKGFGSKTTSTFHTNNKGVVRFECTDTNNDQFTTEFVDRASFVGDETSTISTYTSDALSIVLDVYLKSWPKPEEAEPLSMIIGENGSITAILQGYSVILLPNIQEEE